MVQVHLEHRLCTMLVSSGTNTLIVAVLRVFGTRRVLRQSEREIEDQRGVQGGMVEPSVLTSRESVKMFMCEASTYVHVTRSRQ